MNFKFSLVIGAVAVASSSFAGVLTNSVGTVANQAWTGSLGLDFNVGASPLLVTGLGAFDGGLDGFMPGTSITVSIYDRVSQTIIGSSAVFTGSGDALVDAWREKAVTPFILAAGGQYSVVAVGFNGIDGNYNTSSTSDASTNSAPGLLTFVGTSRYSYGTAYPEILDQATIRYGAGNLSVQAVPEPSTLAGLAGVALVALRRRRARR